MSTKLWVDDVMYMVDEPVAEYVDNLINAIECAINSLNDDKCRECNLDIAARHILEEALKGE